MAGRVVEEKQPLRISIREPFDDVDCVVYLGKKVIGCEPAIPVLPSPEYYPGFAVKE